MTTILGISAWYHDSACALICDGQVIAAAQEERFSRIKGDAAFPSQAMQFCLASADIERLEQIDIIAFYDKPFIKFERLLETHLHAVPWGLSQFARAMPSWIKQKLMARRTLEKSIRAVFADPKTPLPKLLFNDHHGSHAAMAFYPSPFRKAAILSLDGVGEWATSSAWIGTGNQLTPLWEINFPHSLGLLYSAFTSFCGFRVNSGEYKLMGLAPYGEPSYVALIEEHLINIRPDGSFRLNLDYFSFPHGLRMTNRKFAKLFGGPALPLGHTPSKREMDIAASIQKVVEKVLLRAASHLQQTTGLDSLCLGGGVALNCVANSVLRRANIFQHIWVGPAPGDAGSAIGCALSAWHEYLAAPRTANTEILQHALAGPKWTNADIQSALSAYPQIKSQSFDQEALLQTTAQLIADGKVVGWFQGKMEFGARALGNRSILADPRDANMIRRLNLKIKKRESFRPFAASVLADQAADWFDSATSSPFMNTVMAVKHSATDNHAPLHQLDSIHQKRSAIPAVTHVNMSCRIHTVTQEQNPLFYQLIKRFAAISGVPLLINTSFNVRGEPIVCSPDDALNCFLNTDMDALVIGNQLILKPA